MASIADIRAKFPQYSDMSDQQLADAVHKKFYADMPVEEFNAKVGFTADPNAQAVAAGLPVVDPSMQSDGNSPSPAFQQALAQLHQAAGSLKDAPIEDRDRLVRANMEATKINQMKGPAKFLSDSADAAAGGALGNFADEAYSGTVGAGARMLRDQVGYGEAYKREQALQAALEKKRNPVANIAGQIGGGLATAATLGGGGATLAGRNIPLLGPIGGAALEGGAYGAVYGAGGAEAGKRLEGAKYGALTGAATGAAGEGLMRGVRRLITPMPIAAERQAMVDTLGNEGVQLTAGQTTGNKTLLYQESELGGGAGANLMERQGEQFTAAALRRAGIDANRATPEVIDQGFHELGQQFDDLAARNAVIPDRQMVTDLRTTLQNYNHLVPETARAPIVDNLARDVVTAAQQPGGIAGEAYQALRSRLDRMARAAAADPQLSNALRGIRNTVDDAMERSIQANNPADAGAWQQVRNHYRNMLVIERAATGAGENAAGGIISPSALRNAVVGQGRRAYARGLGDLAQLARAGERLMKPLPNSGTASRTAARNMMVGIPALIGGGAGAAGGPLGAMAGGIAGAAIPFAAGRALLSAPVRGYLSNQLLAPAGAATGSALRPALNAIGGSSPGLLPRL